MKGFVALTIILIILALSLTLGLGISLLSISEMTMGLKKNFSSKSYYLANLCAEEALIKLKDDINYQGDEPPITIEEGNCQILKIEGNWIVKTIGNYQNQVKKMKIVVSQIKPKMIIKSWQEVADF